MESLLHLSDAVLNKIRTSMSVAMEVGIRMIMEVSSSKRYSRTMDCEKALHRTVRTERPTMSFLARQNDISFLNARKSNSN